MEKTQFEGYLNDNEVIKLGGFHGGHYLYNKTWVVFFAFFHKGIELKNSESMKRVMLDVMNLKDYQGPKPLPEIKSEQLILVNSVYPNYGMLFKIIIDEVKKTAKLKLKKYPELGHLLITEEEKHVSINF